MPGSIGDIFSDITREAKQTGLVILFIIVIVLVLLVFNWLSGLFG
jgi:hypothetical protein